MTTPSLISFIDYPWFDSKKYLNSNTGHVFFNSTNQRPPGTPGVSKNAQKYFINKYVELWFFNPAKVD